MEKLAHFIYTTLLRPRALRALANRVITWCLPSSIRRHGAIVVLNRRDPVVSGALTFRVYERAESHFFLSACRESRCFIDIGANAGYYTALAMTQLGSGGTVVALEPDPENYQILLKTIASNSGARVIPLPKAAGDRECTMTLYRNLSNRGDNRLYPSELPAEGTSVEVVRINSLTDELGLPSVDLIKIDVQGFEGQVIAGMSRTLSRSKQLTVLLECWPEGLRNAGTDPRRLLDTIEEHGYTINTLTSRGSLQPIGDKDALIHRYAAPRYVSLVAKRMDG